ncbi:prolyl oligopeptidase family serine peptidase [Nesterenkonia alkaliphila]|uniref:prolyl oligopeptidase family serine peptidase n=1 Tax=Nesterenkonia alkaliphila TaxID=1463631 RepID=UPI0012F72DDD|nr:prolyl oligopeptidase family serine peptidase [Nesterenkonia alkaliphila]GFZ79229.1 dipeptidyl aminopeptidase [Nesterenkonia alkaliphila]
MVTTLPYGSWPSSISAEQLAVGGNRLGGPQWVGDELWWTEAVAAEGGRQSIVRTAAAVTQSTERPETITVLPAPFNARSRVHEYGGASWTAVEDDGTGLPLIVFVNFADQRIYRFREGEDPVPISPVGPEVSAAGGPSLRWAQPTPVSLPGGSLEIWWVCEHHLDEKDSAGVPRIERYIASVPLDGSAAEDIGAVRRITPSSRFVADPQVSPDGRHLAWISWEHPQMPWDGTELHIGELADTGAGGVVMDETVVDGNTEISVLNPRWRSATELLYVSDASGWWNPWRLRIGAAPEQVLSDEQEYGGPYWQLGSSWLELLEDGRALTIHGRATDKLGVLEPDSAELRELDLPHTAIASVTVSATGLLAVYGGRADEFAAISVAPLRESSLGPLRTIRSSRQDAPDPGLLPTPEPITVTDASGEEVHAVLYRPQQAGYAGPAGELPPFIAQVHGGPTAKAPVGLALATAYYTSRGIGVVDINYGGSTGFGRAYRDRLKGAWGVVDVQDAVTVMEHLVEAGIADGGRLGIEGGSAGGWTTLACLTRTDTFSAGVSSFGVADAVALAQDTHDFESRYLDQLIGRYPEDEHIYRERAPLNHVASLSCPVLLLQGDEDPIVPPNQAEMFRDALAAKGIPHAYLLFEGEQHGFRKAENIIASNEAALSFYGQIFGFETPGIPRLELSR